jgi:hypothetical protein
MNSSVLPRILAFSGGEHITLVVQLSDGLRRITHAAWQSQNTHRKHKRSYEGHLVSNTEAKPVWRTKIWLNHNGFMPKVQITLNAFATLD